MNKTNYFCPESFHLRFCFSKFPFEIITLAFTVGQFASAQKPFLHFFRCVGKRTSFYDTWTSMKVLLVIQAKEDIHSSVLVEEIERETCTRVEGHTVKSTIDGTQHYRILSKIYILNTINHLNGIQ